jgi:hypothetical protein
MRSLQQLVQCITEYPCYNQQRLGFSAIQQSLLTSQYQEGISV